MTRIKAIPATVVLACVLGAFNPLEAADRHYQRTSLPQAVGLPRVNPVGVDQEPRLVLAGEVVYYGVQDRSIPWWVGDEACDVADQNTSRILTFDMGGAWLYVPCGGTDMSFVFEIPDEAPVPGTGLTEPFPLREPR